MLQCYTVILVWVVSVAHSKVGDKRYVVWVEDAMFSVKNVTNYHFVHLKYFC